MRFNKIPFHHQNYDKILITFLTEIVENGAIGNNLNYY